MDKWLFKTYLKLTKSMFCLVYALFVIVKLIKVVMNMSYPGMTRVAMCAVL